jgi:hypothetical protein
VPALRTRASCAHPCAAYARPNTRRDHGPHTQTRISHRREPHAPRARDFTAIRPRSECRRTAVGISVQRIANPAWCGLSSVCATHPRAPCAHAMRCAHMNVLPRTQAGLRPTPRPCGRGGQQRIALPRCPARRRRDRSALGAPSPEEYLKVITGKLRRAGGEGGCPTPRRMPVQLAQNDPGT